MGTYSDNTTIKVSGGGVIDANYGGSDSSGTYFTIAADEYAILNVILATCNATPGGSFTINIGAAEIIQLDNSFNSVSAGGQANPDAIFSNQIFIPPGTSLSYVWNSASSGDSANFKAVYTKFKNSVP